MVWQMMESISLCLDSKVIVRYMEFALAMQQITAVIAIISVSQVSLGKPINNGFSYKLNPIFVREDNKPKTFGALFAKIPQESTQAADIRQGILSEAYFSHASTLGSDCTKHIMKISFPSKRSYKNSSLPLEVNYINIPIIQQPFSDYKIVVATAPSNIKISGAQAKPLVLYVVFPEDETSDAQSINIPTVYFVSNSRSLHNLKKELKVDPILIIDSNRTVTGLKSKEVAKFVKFKNKMTSRYSYEVERR